MTERLTDEELFQLVQEKTPDELTLEEIDQLKQRLEESPELQQMLIGQVSMEGYLSSALAEVKVSPDDIIQKANEQHPEDKNGRKPWWALLLLLLIGVGIAGVMHFQKQPEPEQLADNETIPPSAEEAKEETDTPLKVEPKEEKEDVGPPVKPEEEPKVVGEPKPPADVPPKPEKIEAWTKALANETPAKEFAEVAFLTDGEPGRYEFSTDEFRKWFEAVPRQQFDVREGRYGQNQRLTQFRGMAKLKAPWTEQAALRFSTFNPNPLQIHIWNGEEGVSFQYFARANPHQWGAYRLRKGEKSPQPTSPVLLTTDNGRHRRAGFGPVQLRWQNEHLVLTRGDVRLLTVPFSSLPEELYVEGEFVVAHVSMIKSTPVPAEPANSRPMVFQADRPADHPWVTNLQDGSALVMEAEGSVELIGQSPVTPVHAGIVLPNPGLREVIVHVSNMEQGTGVYLGDADGNPLYRVAFFHDRRNQRLTVGTLDKNQTHTEVDHDPNSLPAPWLGDEVWLRIIAGYGSLKLDISPDGKQWGPAIHKPGREGAPDWRSIGLFTLRQEPSRHIRLNSLEIREFSAITSLIDDELQGAAANLPFSTVSGNPTDWAELVVKALPIDTDFRDWWRTCAVMTLTSGNPYLPLHLIDPLITSVIFDNSLTAEARFRFLDELTLLLDTWYASKGLTMQRHYEELGRRVERETGHAQAEFVLRRLIEAPMRTEGTLSMYPPALLDDSFERLVYQQRWSEVERLADRVRFWNTTGDPNQRANFDRTLVNKPMTWAETLAGWNGSAAGDQRDRLHSDWAHPLHSQWSKEGDNLMAEFEAALTSNAYEDAAQLISSTDFTDLQGLLPDAKEKGLLVSFPNAIALAMREHPALRTMMQDQQGPVGLVRVRQAITRNDVAKIEAGTLHFYGTPAAAEAHRWLGDRALSTGRFSGAVEHYRKALESVDETNRPTIESSIRLAGALQGVTLGEPLTVPVQVGGKVYSAEEFEALIQSLLSTRQSNTDATAVTQSDTKSPDAPPPPGVFRAERRGQLSDSLGKGSWPYNTRGLDWSARQLAVTSDADTFYVSNRYQLTAFDAKSGKQRWTSSVGGAQGEIRNWPLVKAKPLLVGDRVYVRRLTNRGFELACVDRKTGKQMWKQHPDRHVASDPVFVHQKLMALVVTAPQNKFLQLELTTFHPETGAVLAQRPVLKLRDIWSGRPPCVVQVVDGLILCAVDGVILCCDSLGQKHWVRKQVWLPDQINSWWPLDFAERMTVQGQHLFAYQPGTREVVCLELKSGRDLWSVALPKVNRVLGLTSDTLIVQTTFELLGLNAKTGEIRWQRDHQNALDARLVGDGRVLVSRQVVYGTKHAEPLLIWIDPATGEEQATLSLPELTREKVTPLGPLVAVDGKFWVFAGQDGKTGQRELYELIPNDELTPPGAVSPLEFINWLPHVLEKSKVHTAAILPGWTLLTTQNYPGRFKGAELVDEHHGVRRVLLTRTGSGQPVKFFRQVTVPDVGATNLVIVGGHDKGTGWELEIEILGESVLKEAVNSKTAPTGWYKKQLDLSKYRGQTVGVFITQNPADSKKSGDAWWKSLRIETESEKSE